MAKTIELHFEGYCLTKDLPLDDCKYSGIYIVYRGKMTGKNQCKLLQLLYIGESEEVGTRPGKQHESYKEWCSYLDREEKELLFYSFTKVSADNRERAEAALIFHHQPPCNMQNTESFDYPETRIIISGDSDFLHTDFIEPEDS